MARIAALPAAGFALGLLQHELSVACPPPRVPLVRLAQVRQRLKTTCGVQRHVGAVMGWRAYLILRSLLPQTTGHCSMNIRHGDGYRLPRRVDEAW